MDDCQEQIAYDLWRIHKTALEVIKLFKFNLNLKYFLIF